MLTLASWRNVGPLLRTRRVTTLAAIVVGQLATGLALLVLARRLSVDTFGELASVYTMSLALSGFLDFGSSARMIRSLVQGRAADSAARWLFNRSALQTLPAFCFMAVMVAVYGDSLGATNTVLIASQAFFYPVALGSFAIVSALRSPALAQWLIAVGNAALLLIACIAPLDRLLTFAAIGVPLSWILTFLLSMGVARSRIGFARPDHANPWHGATAFGVHSLATTATGFSVGVVSFASGPEAAGQAGAVQRFAQPIATVASSIAIADFPRFAAAATHADGTRILRRSWPLMALGAISGAVLALAAPVVVSVLLGQRYADAVLPLRLMALGMIPVLIAQPLSALLQARGEEHAVARVTAVGTVGYFVILLATAPWIGASSIGFASIWFNAGLLVAYALTLRKLLQSERRVRRDRTLAALLDV